MAKRDWKALQQEYKLAFDERGISIKAWCDEKGINYNTARRYLQVITSDDENSDQCAKTDTQTHITTPTPNEKWPQSGGRVGGAEKEKQKKSKGNGRKKDVISKSDQSTDQNSDHFTDHFEKAERMELIRRMLGVDMSAQRDEKGRFVTGHQMSVVHNGYTARLKNPDAAFDAAESEIDYEISFARAKLMETIEIYYKINEDLARPDLNAADKARLYELRRDTDTNVDRGLHVIGNLLKTKAQVYKMELEAARIEQESKGLGTSIADIVKEIQDMDSTGFVLNE
ncbi:hypothetical protein [Vibrio vulnificus]|uniref:hypothetical protein n=1 Tax=Vibrio vulnificus TaxID=672 RepID=UPI000505F801|nr:hypothetical protein [Vibrio vulnificus]KFK55269.1 hypothetical protein JS86_08025 [Vibrio vulnificus]